MNKSTLFKHLLIASAISIPTVMSGGNIPQYTFGTSQNAYAALTNATRIPVNFEELGSKACAVFANGSLSDEAQTAIGFPIGFDFKYAGSTVDQFVPTTSGAIFFGKGYVKIESEPDLALKAGDHMGYVNMHAGIISAEYSTNSGEIYYKTEGEDGNKVTTVEFRNMELNEPNSWSSKRATFSLQIRLYQKDNSIEMSWAEEISPTLKATLFAGLKGWDSADGLIIGGDIEKGRYKRSFSTSASTSIADANIAWFCNTSLSNPFKFNWKFTPSASDVLPQDAPKELKAEQNGTDLTITCDRGADADATVILISEHPFTDADMPKDGETFPIHLFSKGNKFVTSFGNATALYYGNDDIISVTYPNIKDAQTYYIKALSVNGTPLYNKENTADIILSAANAAPENISVTPTSSSFVLTWDCPINAIVAMTTERVANPKYPYSNKGEFGKPSADVKIGDEIPGGGKVVYIGNDNECIVNDVPANEMVYFALWSTDGEVISADPAYTFGTTMPTLPFEPKLEKRALHLIPEGWDSSDGISYSVQQRPGDKADALLAMCENDEPALESPLLPMDEATKLTFEFALETAADAGMASGGDTSKGTVPGYFAAYPTDDANGSEYAIFIKVGDNEIKRIQQYNGEMDSKEDGKFVKGSSTFVPAEVEIPAQEGRKRISISFRTHRNSDLWIRNFKLEKAENGGVGIECVENITDTPVIFSGNGFIALSTTNNTDIYSIEGVRVASVADTEGNLVKISLPAGIYIVNGTKVVVK